MTTVIMAKTYEDAAKVALGLSAGQDWLYPHSAHMLQGVQVTRLVYVEGWLHSSSITTDTAAFVQSRLTPDARVVTLTPEGGMAWATPQAPAPFVPLMVPDDPNDWRGRRRPRRAPQAAMAAVFVGCAVIAGGLVAVLKMVGVL